MRGLAGQGVALGSPAQMKIHHPESPAHILLKSSCVLVAEWAGALQSMGRGFPE